MDFKATTQHENEKYYHSDISLLELSPSYVLVYCKQLTEFLGKAQRKKYTSKVSAEFWVHTAKKDNVVMKSQSPNYY